MNWARITNISRVCVNGCVSVCSECAATVIAIITVIGSHVIARSLRP